MHQANSVFLQPPKRLKFPNSHIHVGIIYHAPIFFGWLHDVTWGYIVTICYYTHGFPKFASTKLWELQGNLQSVAVATRQDDPRRAFSLVRAKGPPLNLFTKAPAFFAQVTAMVASLFGKHIPTLAMLGYGVSINEGYPQMDSIWIVYNEHSIWYDQAI